MPPNINTPSSLPREWARQVGLASLFLQSRRQKPAQYGTGGCQRQRLSGFSVSAPTYPLSHPGPAPLSLKPMP